MNITQKVVTFQVGHWTLESTLKEIQAYTIGWIMKKWRWSEEEANEFWVYILPKVRRVIYKFSFSGRSFLRYLHKFIHFQMKSYRKSIIGQEIKNKHIEKSIQSQYQLENHGNNLFIKADTDHWPESYETDFEVDYAIAEGHPSDIQSVYIPPENADNKTRYFEDLSDLSAESKRLLISVFQFMDYVDDETLMELSKKSSIPFVQLLAIRQESYEYVQDRIEMKQELHYRRNRRLMQFQFEYEERSVREKNLRLLSHTLERIRKVRTHPSFNELAQVTGIPRGTIGSCVNSHKKQVHFDTNSQQ